MIQSPGARPVHRSATPWEAARQGTTNREAISERREQFAGQREGPSFFALCFIVRERVCIQSSKGRGLARASCVTFRTALPT